MAPSQAMPSALPHREISQDPSPPSCVTSRPPEQQAVLLPTPSMTPSSFRSPCGPSASSTPGYTSLQSSPEGPRGRHLPASHPPTPLQLPDPLVATPTNYSQTATGEGAALNKGPGLIRRISGAASKLRRRRQPSNIRDRSSGPVMMRRRSESKSGAELDVGRPGPTSSLDEDYEEWIEGPTPLHGLVLTADGV